MSESVLPPGKLPAKLLSELVVHPDALPPDVLLGPRVGEDGCAISLGGEVLVVATDPITLTGSDVGAHAVKINANDVAVMGAAPRWFLATVLLPVGVTEAEVRALFHSMYEELRSANVALVGGHTEVTAAVGQTVVVGQMLGTVSRAGLVKTGGLRPGDAVLQVGLAPVEGAAVMAEAFADRLGGVPAELVQAAAAAVATPGISVVNAALRAAALGACAMHDPTEGGLSAGLHEMAQASAVALEVDLGAVRWFEPGKRLCEALGADPLGMLASGALLAGVPAQRSLEVVSTLASDGFPVALIGRALAGSGVWTQAAEPVPRYERDELSRLFEEAVMRRAD